MTITNQQFADVLGCHHTMASRIRNGQRMPSVRSLRKIAAAYGVSEQELLQAAEEGTESFGRLVRTRIFDAEG